jgi:hypothetical protein
LKFHFNEIRFTPDATRSRQEDSMRVGIVGGLDRSGHAFQRVAREHGHEVEHHTGDMHGHASLELERLVDRADLVVIVTEINSHIAVQLTRRLLRARARPPVLVRRLGVARLLALLDEHAPPSWPAATAAHA